MEGSSSEVQTPQENEQNFHQSTKISHIPARAVYQLIFFRSPLEGVLKGLPRPGWGLRSSNLKTVSHPSGDSDWGQFIHAENCWGWQSPCLNMSVCQKCSPLSDKNLSPTKPAPACLGNSGQGSPPWGQSRFLANPLTQASMISPVSWEGQPLPFTKTSPEPSEIRTRCQFLKITVLQIKGDTKLQKIPSNAIYKYTTFCSWKDFTGMIWDSQGPCRTGWPGSARRAVPSLQIRDLSPRGEVLSWPKVTRRGASG